MTEIEKTLGTAVKGIKDQLAEVLKQNEDLQSQIVEMEKKGLTPQEAVKSINDNFKKAVREAKGAEDIVGKSFFLQTKEAKLGANEYYDEFATIGVDKRNAYLEAKKAFGETKASGNLVNHTYHQGRSILTLNNGDPIPECIEAEECEYEYAKASFAIDKYACKYPTSIEFTEFVTGGIANAVNSLVIDLNNLFTKYSLNADAPLQNHFGLFNTSTARAFDRVEVATAGLVTGDDLLDARFAGNGTLLLSGFYFMPVSTLQSITKLKDNEGAYLFSAGSNGQSILGFDMVGTIGGKAVYVVPDDVWFASGSNSESSAVPLFFYGTKEAFEYYAKPITQYQNYVNDVFTEGDVLIEVRKDSNNTGCFELHALFFRGFGVTDPGAGVLYVNPTVAP